MSENLNKNILVPEETEAPEAILAPEATELFLAAEEAVGSNGNYVEAFRGDSAFREQERDTFFDAQAAGEDFEPALNQHTGLDSAKAHRARIEAYGRVSALEAIASDQPLVIAENGLLRQTLAAQKAKLTFLQGAEAFSHAPHLGAAKFMGENAGDQLADSMRSWAGEIWRPADPQLARPLIAAHLPYALQAKEMISGSMDPQVTRHLNTFIDVARSLGEQPAPIMPTPEELQALHELVMERFGDTFDYIFAETDDEKQAFNQEEAAGLFTRALEHRGLTQHDWRVVIDNERDNMSADSHEKIIYVGKRSKPFARMDVMRLTVHEIGVHAESAQNAKNHDMIAPANFGMPGYLASEEGLANVLEFGLQRKVTDKLHRYRYAGGSLAQGAVDGKKRKFPEMFSPLAGYAIAEMVRLGKDVNDKTVAAELKVAYNQAVRSNRGMPAVPGVNDLSGLSYYDGAKRVWSQYFSQANGAPGLDRQVFDSLFLAKYDRTDPSQRQLVLAMAK